MEKNIEDIIVKQLASEKLSEDEKVCFENWYKDVSHQMYYQELLKIHSGVMACSAKDNIDCEKAWKKIRPVRRVLRIYQVLKYAAIFLLPVGIAFFWFMREQENVKTVAVDVVKPGEKLAVLTLSTGKQVVLADTTIQVDEGGMMILNLPDKELIYEAKDSSLNTETIYNTITVPRGGEYKLVLSDGTIVWLNSESHIHYPIAFGGDVRRVELEGEAYFEVAKHVEKPFIVHMKGYDVRVTGTQFNVRNYSTENLATTLVEGGVQIERKGEIVKLKPGLQAVLGNDELIVREVNVEEQVAWRHGAFGFTQCRLENIMEELARWYDVDVFYMNQQVKDYHFSAWFKRSSSINEVISILEKTKKISLDLKGRLLMVKDISRN